MVGYTRGLLETGKVIAPVVIDRILNPYGRKQAPRWAVLEQERKPHDPLFVKYNMSGKVDGIRHVESTEGRERPCNVVEVKTCDGNIFRQINELHDLDKWAWMAKYPDQVMLYMLGCELVDRPGWLVLVNKNNLWNVTVLEVPFDMERSERLLRRAARINFHVTAGTLPDQIARPDICGRCEFLHVCTPTLEGNPEAVPEPVDDAEVVALVRQYAETTQAARINATAKKTLRGRLVPGQRLNVDGHLVDWKRHGKGWQMNVIGPDDSDEDEDDNVVAF